MGPDHPELRMKGKNMSTRIMHISGLFAALSLLLASGCQPAPGNCATSPILGTWTQVWDLDDWNMEHLTFGPTCDCTVDEFEGEDQRSDLGWFSLFAGEVRISFDEFTDREGDLTNDALTLYEVGGTRAITYERQ